MAQQQINNGESAASVRTKINSNFGELYLAPRMIVGDQFYSLTNPGHNVLELFWEGMLEHPAPENFSFHVSGGADAYRALRRKYKVSFGTDFEHSSIVFRCHDFADREVVTASSNIKIVTAANSPALPTRVLCIGDSLTYNPGGAAAWVSELNRMLTDTVGTGTPPAFGFSNISFIGTQGTGSNLHEGYSGRDVEWFATDPSSPFMNGGSLDFANYVTTNAFGGIEQVYILLGHNSILDPPTDKSTASGWAADIAHYETLIAAILADFPSARITLLSLQGYGREGMIGNRDWSNLVRNAFGHKLAVKSIADGTYSANVDWLDLASQFDIKYNQPATATNVNLRNSTVTELVVSDPIHPNTPGNYQIADATLRDFVANYCL